MDKVLNIISNDPWLEPYADAINGRHGMVINKEKELTRRCSLEDFASGHLYFGLHKIKEGKTVKWVLREWAPNASAIYVVGDFNGWKETPEYQLTKIKKT